MWSTRSWSRAVGPETPSAAKTPSRPSTGAAIAGQPGLELVDGGGVALPAARRRARPRAPRGSRRCGRCAARAGRRAGAARRRRRAPCPAPSSAGGRRPGSSRAPRAGTSTRPARCARRRRRGATPRCTVSPVCSPTASSTGRASRAICGHGSCSAACSANSGPATYPPAGSRSTSSVRSRAASSREVVERARPVSSLSSVKLSGSSARTTRSTSAAARSTAWVPAGAALLIATSGVATDVSSCGTDFHMMRLGCRSARVKQNR